ncbi:hypothetical protein, partial [Pseudomonas sp. ESBL9]|uniref:hypothetical protein n=1 Tax=Pseudomonas sp. ESBL9 TaxID=3077327 RepID=UPI002FC92DAD
MKNPIEVKLGLNEKNFYLRIPKRMKGTYPFDMEIPYVKRIVNEINRIAVKLLFSTGNMIEVDANNPFSTQEFFIFKFDFIDDEECENRGLLEELNEVLSKYSNSCCSQCVYMSVYNA